MTCTQPKRLNKYWIIHKEIHIGLQHNDNTRHIIENFSSSATSMRPYDVPAIPSCLRTATQTTHHDSAVLQRAGYTPG